MGLHNVQIASDKLLRTTGRRFSFWSIMIINKCTETNEGQQLKYIYSKGQGEIIISRHNMTYYNICEHTLCIRATTLASKSGPGCSKLTISLVNVSLKFQTLISQICQYFLLKKCVKLLQCKSVSYFFNKNFSVFGYKVVQHLKIYSLVGNIKMIW